MARKKKIVEPVVELGTAFGIIAIKQVCRLRNLLATPDDHDGVLDRRIEYQAAIGRNGLKAPQTLEECDLLIESLRLVHTEEVAKWI